MYTANQPSADLLLLALAEVFQDTRTVVASAGLPTFTIFRLTRAITAVYLTEDGPPAPGDASRKGAQQQARAFYAQAELDGIVYLSALNGNPGVPERATNLVLWDPRGAYLPEKPAFSYALADPLLIGSVAEACSRLGYTFLE